MNINRLVRRIVADSQVRAGRGGTMRIIVCGVFIALIALFFTSPATERSAYDKPLPLPAELGLDDVPPPPHH